ncbi:MAG: SDR family oxidoreductase [candidate division KSB1 bacterium]|nr:SDR family oxidoreductase [candidate division KSB1 bacterium]
MDPNRRILITGASGFLGGWLVQAAAEHGQVFAVYRRRAFPDAPARWLPCDLSDAAAAAALIRDVAPQVVIHAAAAANLDWCEEHRDQAYRINVCATQAIAQTCAAIGARLVYISSDMVFDGEQGGYAETDPVHPLSFYGWTKVEGERAVREAIANSVIVRTALMFGDPLYGGSSFSVWLEGELEAGKPVRLFMDQFRSPLWVGTAAQAIVELALSEFVGTLHLGGTERIDRFSFGSVLAEALGLRRDLLMPVPLRSVPMPAPRPRDLSLKVDLARSVLRTELQDVRTAVRELVRWRKLRSGSLTPK